jgi:hypothetical protein
MALTLTELQAVTDDYILNRTPEDVYFRDNVLIYKLMKKGKSYDGGLKIQTNLEYAKQHTGSYGPRTEFPVQKKEILTAAFFKYAAYFGVSTYDMEDDLLNAGDAAIVNIIQAKLRNMQKSIRDTMAIDIWRSLAANIAASEYGDPKPFSGVADLFSQVASFKYGEIAPEDLLREDGTTSMWKAAYTHDAITMGFKGLQAIRRIASLGPSNSDKPDLYITTELLKDAFEASEYALVRHSDKNLVDAGFDNVLFKGAAVVADERQTAGQVDGYNLRFLDIIHHSQRNFTKPVWKAEIRTPETFTCNIRWMGQLVCSNRLGHVRADNVSAPA